MVSYQRYCGYAVTKSVCGANGLGQGGMRERLDLGSDLWKIRAEPKQDGQRLVVQSLFERRLLTHPGLTEAGDHRIETVRMSVGGSMMLAAV